MSKKPIGPKDLFDGSAFGMSQAVGVSFASRLARMRQFTEMLK